MKVYQLAKARRALRLLRRKQHRWGGNISVYPTMKPIVTFSRGRVPRLSCNQAPRELVGTSSAAAEAWLRRAQDANTDGGVSYGYSLLAGWRPSYPETSGYIATTFFRLARERDPSYAERARRIHRWLLSVQNADGSFSNPRYGKRGIVFDAGQALFGLVKGFELTGSRE